MRKSVVIGVALTITLLITGCTSPETAVSDEEQGEPVMIDQGGLEVIDIEKVDPLNLSEEAQKELEAQRLEEGSYVFSENGKFYLAVFAGVRNTGGYSLEITDVVLAGEELTVSAVETVPGPDMMVTDALTYPSDLVELTGIDSIENLVVLVRYGN